MVGMKEFYNRLYALNGKIPLDGLNKILFPI
jgi:hypothetical protein